MCDVFVGMCDLGRYMFMISVLTISYWASVCGYLCVGALWPAGVSCVGMFVGVEGCV